LTAGFRLPIVNTADDRVKDHQFSQELQFLGRLFDNRISYVAGLYYFSEGASHFNYGTIPTYALIKQRLVKMNSKSKAVFGQMTWTPGVLDDRLKLTFGARYTQDDRSASRVFIINGVVRENGAATGAVNDQSFSRFNPSFTASYDWSDDLSTYAKVSTGYKAGGSSESGLIGSFNLTFGPEKVTVYELGLKSNWFDRRLRLNVAAFDSQIKDMQLAFIVNPLDGSFSQGYNAGKGSIRGIEVEALLAPIADLTLSLNYTYLDPKISEIKALAGTIFDPSVNSASPYRVGDNIKDLFNMPFTAKNSLDLSADYTFLRFDTSSVSAHLDYLYKSSVFQSAPTGKAVPNGHFFEEPSHGILNGRVTLAFDLPRGEKARVSLWGRNLTDKRYTQQVIGQGGIIPIFTGTSVRAPGFVSNAVIWSEPISYGIELNYEY
jgi:iron complex outermembrane receptor protein